MFTKFLVGDKGERICEYAHAVLQERHSEVAREQVLNKLRA